MNEFICAHVKLFKPGRYEGLERLSVVKVMNACLHMGTHDACPRDGVNLWSGERVHKCTRIHVDGSAGVHVILCARELLHICTCAQMHMQNRHGEENPRGWKLGGATSTTGARGRFGRTCKV